MNTWLLAAVAALATGVFLLLKSSKERQENGDWSSGLQWGYLAVLAGTFGLLAQVMSFTAVFLIFVLFTGALWLWHKVAVKKEAEDGNHFRDYLGSFFPIMAVLFMLRAFVAEPFQIPSSSMRPGLSVGDFILTSKSSYGIRIPVLNKVLIDTGSVERGDVVVFNYPENPDVNYIKRTVGLPGDLVEYKDKTLYINGQALSQTADGVETYPENTPAGMRDISAERFTERLGERSYTVLKMPEYPSFLPQGVRADFPYRENCQYAEDGSAFSCRVPDGHYFMMGDNRDNSEDSRYWGFVADEYIVGKAFLIWLNLGDFSRIGSRIR
ncbi:MAG: signal peptidase I [Neisseria sp.]|nr:signal peptidase I [Neisseria sp.]